MYNCCFISTGEIVEKKEFGKKSYFVIHLYAK